MKTRERKRRWRYVIPFNIKLPSLSQNRRDNSNKILQDGKRNDFPQYLIDLVERAPFTKSAIERRGAFVVGRGFSDPALGETPVNDDYNLSEFHERIARDFNYSGRYAFLIFFRRGGQIASIKHVPFEWVRYGDPGNNSTDVWYGSINPHTLTSDDAPKSNTYYPLYQPGQELNLAQDMARVQEEFKQEYAGHLVFFNSTSPRNRIYSRPAYFSAQNAIHADAGQWQFLERFLANNMFMGGIINKYGDPDEAILDEKGDIITTVGEEFGNEISDMMSGTSNAGAFLVNWYQEGDPADIKPWQNGNNHEVLESIRGAVREILSVAIGVPQALLGVQTSGKLGDVQEIRNAIKATNENTEAMRATLEDLYKKILPMMGVAVPEDFAINKLQDFTDIPQYVFNALTTAQKQQFIADEYGIEADENAEQQEAEDNREEIELQEMINKANNGRYN